MIEKILVVGSGAREHAIAAALDRSPQTPEVLCFGTARNPGIAEFCRSYRVGDITDAEAVAAWAAERGATLAIIGPEAALAGGVADALEQRGIGVVGPVKALAQIETSKGFARELMARHSIAGNPRFARFDAHSLEAAEAVLLELPMKHVIKDDGLAGGKGVKVCGDHLHTHAESVAFCRELSEAGHAFVIEEKLEGEEFSLLSFSDGITLRHMPAVQDHKRAFAGDTGPNTGGMGSYSCADGSLPFLEAADITAAQRINEAVVAALLSETGKPYKGVLYGGFMATHGGVRVVEFNARFGDPECLNLLTLLESDFVSICSAIVTQTLHQVEAVFTTRATVCKYVVPAGYPDAPRKGDPVPIPPTDDDVTTYLGAVDVAGDRLVATGSRTLAFVAAAATLASAEAMCEEAAEAVSGPFFHRSDIGTAALIASRVQHMRQLRSAQKEQ